jgi:hypothetical protein
MSSAISFRSQSWLSGPDLAVDQTSGLPWGSRLSTGVDMSEAGSRPRVTVAGRLCVTWVGWAPPVEVGACVVLGYRLGRGPPVEVARWALARRGLRRVGAVGGGAAERGGGGGGGGGRRAGGGGGGGGRPNGGEQRAGRGQQYGRWY